jgi:hypothetical protein
LGFLAVLSLGLPFLMAQGQWTPKVAGANSFILHDADGTIRAKLAFCGEDPCLTFLDWGGKKDMELTKYLFQLGGDSDKMGVVQFSAASFGPAIDTNASPDEIRKAVDASARFAKPLASIFLGAGTEKSRLGLVAEASEAHLLLHDSNGFETILGNTDPVTERTGETHKTSAALLVLFGKDGKVLWSAP